MTEPTSPVTLRLLPDFSVIEELQASVARLAELGNVPDEAVDALLSALQQPADLFRFESDDATTPAGELRVALKPTDRLLGLVAALGAGNADARG